MDKQNILQADRKIMQRLIIAYAAGRSVDLPNILKHELMSVPLSLAQTDQTLRTGPKHILGDERTKGINCPENIVLQGDPVLIIDGHALARASDWMTKRSKDIWGPFKCLS